MPPLAGKAVVVIGDCTLETEPVLNISIIISIISTIIIASSCTLSEDA